MHLWAPSTPDKIFSCTWWPSIFMLQIGLIHHHHICYICDVMWPSLVVIYQSLIGQYMDNGQYLEIIKPAMSEWPGQLLHQILLLQNNCKKKQYHELKFENFMKDIFVGSVKIIWELLSWNGASRKRQRVNVRRWEIVWNMRNISLGKTLPMKFSPLQHQS